MTIRAPDRRQHPRVAVDLPVEFRVRKGPRFAGGCSDMSLGGMFVKTADVPPKGTKLRLFVQLLGKTQEMTIPCIVRWSHQHGMGVQFMQLQEPDRVALMECMAAAERAGVSFQ